MAAVAVLGGACAGAPPSDGVGADHGELMILSTPEDPPDEPGRPGEEELPASGTVLDAGARSDGG